MSQPSETNVGEPCVGTLGAVEVIEHIAQELQAPEVEATEAAQLWEEIDVEDRQGWVISSTSAVIGQVTDG